MQLFDAHFHIIDPSYPLIENQGYLPPSFTIEDYLEKVKTYQVAGGCIVSGSFQGFDTSYLKNALQKLGNNFHGVANIPVSISDNEALQLTQANIKGVRFNLKRGGSETLNNMVTLSNRLFQDYGWHTELYVDSKDLKDLRGRLQELPSFSIDHLGLSKGGLNELYRWADKGAKIKATGFGRVDFEVAQVLHRIYQINPDALMFGTDLPSTRAPAPFSHADIQLIQSNFDEKAQKKVFLTNALEWYS